MTMRWAKEEGRRWWTWGCDRACGIALGQWQRVGLGALGHILCCVSGRDGGGIVKSCENEKKSGSGVAGVAYAMKGMSVDLLIVPRDIVAPLEGCAVVSTDLDRGVGWMRER